MAGQEDKCPLCGAMCVVPQSPNRLPLILGVGGGLALLAVVAVVLVVVLGRTPGGTMKEVARGEQIVKADPTPAKLPTPSPAKLPNPTPIELPKNVSKPDVGPASKPGLAGNDGTQAAAQVPESLRGDWLVPSKPNPNSSPMMQLPDTTAITLRITATNLVLRLHKDPPLLDGWSETGERMKTVKDGDGLEYLEDQPFFLTVCTNTVPWQIDLWRKKGDGTRIEKKGICSLEENVLTLSIGSIGKPRPESLDEPGIGSSYSFFKATRTGKPTSVPSRTEDTQPSAGRSTPTASSPPQTASEEGGPARSLFVFNKTSHGLPANGRNGD